MNDRGGRFARRGTCRAAVAARSRRRARHCFATGFALVPIFSSDPIRLDKRHGRVRQHRVKEGRSFKKSEVGSVVHLPIR